MTSRSSGQAPTEHMIVDENGGAEHINPASPLASSYHSSIISYISEPVLNAERMVQEGCSVLDNPCPSLVEAHDLAKFRSASLEPPITITTLSQLDFDHLYNNLSMRHDLNFDPNIQYRPTPNDCQCALKNTEASPYWNAIEIELAGCIGNQACSSSRDLRRCDCAPTVRCPRRTKGPLQIRLVRLPRMFKAVREILHSLLPEEEWLAIDGRLDIHLLIQELENKAFDLLSLSDWLAGLLQRYCLPERDHLINAMTSTMRDGVCGANIRRILSGLIQTFGILETMKLDCANRTIRDLRFIMIDSTVDFEQHDFLHRIAHGWDVDRARNWFAQERRERTILPGLPTLAAAVTDLTITNSNTLPPTLTLDYIRIRTLQWRLEKLMYQSACRWTLEETVDSINQRSIPQSSYNDLYARISVLTPGEESGCHSSRQTEDVALEIVREAYKISACHKIPTLEDLEFAESNLLYASNPSTNVFNSLQRYLAEDLHQLVEDEVKTIRNLTPVQITSRYWSKESIHPRNSTEQTDLLRVAQQIAQISVLHWRVWAPILYDLPDEPHDT